MCTCDLRSISFGHAKAVTSTEVFRSASWFISPVWLIFHHAPFWRSWPWYNSRSAAQHRLEHFKHISFYLRPYYNWGLRRDFHRVLVLLGTGILSALIFTDPPRGGPPDNSSGVIGTSLTYEENFHFAILSPLCPCSCNVESTGVNHKELVVHILILIFTSVSPHFSKNGAIIYHNL